MKYLGIKANMHETNLRNGKNSTHQPSQGRREQQVILVNCCV